MSFALWTVDQNDTDLEALKAVFDTNLNNKIDAGDAQFASLRVWQDKNGDGVTDAGELTTLGAAGIASVNLSVAKTDWLSGGNRVQGFSTYQKPTAAPAGRRMWGLAMSRPAGKPSLRPTLFA